MERHLVETYVRELWIQCKGVLAHVHELNIDLMGRDNYRIIRSIHGVLTHAALISKLLSPSSASEYSQQRAVQLRSLLSIADSDKILSRRLRNHFEHYDERLDDWAQNSENHNLATYSVGGAGMIHSLGEKEQFMRFDPATSELWFRGERMFLAEIIRSVQTIQKKIADYAASDDVHMYLD